MSIGDAPLASRDIDFTGTQENAESLAKSINGQVEYRAKRFDPNPTNAVVSYTDDDGDVHKIDVIKVPLGLRESLSMDAFLAHGVLVTHASSPSVHFKVMHPHHVLISRLTNLHQLPTHRGSHSQSQCLASIICQREFTREILDQRGIREALKHNETVFSYLLNHEAPKHAWLSYQIDARAALLCDNTMGAKYVSTRYPQMLELLGKKWGNH